MHISKSHVNNNELLPFLQDDKPTLNNKIKALFKHQLEDKTGFPKLIESMNTLHNSNNRTITVDEIPIHVFMNLSRKNSVLANTFVPSRNKNTKCILCNLLKGQKGIKILNNNYILLPNPGVTRFGDLTIASIKHKKQLITGNFSDMLSIAREITDYSIYFNGALSGATCPHLHFQAGLRDILPAEVQINNLINGIPVGNASLNLLFKSDNLTTYNIENYLRTTIIALSKSKKELLNFCNYFLENLTELNSIHFKEIENVPNFGDHIEPLDQNENEGRLNIMIKYLPLQDQYLAAFFPKLTNRPSIYFEDEDKRVILGMAIKEALGNIITCRQQDYENVISHPKIIKNAFADTSLPDETLIELIAKLKKFG